MFIFKNEEVNYKYYKEQTTESTKETASTDAKTADASSIKVGVIYVGDENEGYTESHMKGIDEMQSELGLTDAQVIEKTNIPEDESAYDAAVDLADQGCSIIFATSFGHESYLLQAAAEYPEVQFAHATGYQAASSGLSNVKLLYINLWSQICICSSWIKANEMIENGTITAEQAKWVTLVHYAEVVSGYTSFFREQKVYAHP